MAQQFFQLQNSFPPILELKGLNCEGGKPSGKFFFFFSVAAISLEVRLFTTGRR